MRTGPWSVGVEKGVCCIFTVQSKERDVIYIRGLQQLCRTALRTEIASCSRGAQSGFVEGQQFRSTSIGTLPGVGRRLRDTYYISWIVATAAPAPPPAN